MGGLTQITSTVIRNYLPAIEGEKSISGRTNNLNKKIQNGSLTLHRYSQRPIASSLLPFLLLRIPALAKNSRTTAWLPILVPARRRLESRFILLIL